MSEWCKAGKHPMYGDNLRPQKRRGERFPGRTYSERRDGYRCGPCQDEWKRAKRKRRAA